MDLEQSIHEDLNRLASKFLQEIDYEVTSKIDGFAQLLKFKYWKIEDVPRKVSFSKNFRFLNEYSEGVNCLKEKFESGTGEIFRHQSRKLFKGNAQLDGMYHDFGIHHLHLGIERDKKT